MTITAKYSGTCTKCSQPIHVGDEINWEQGSGSSHVTCPAPAGQLVRTGIPQHLETGDIWATKREGVFVVLSTRPAQWTGEDVDVYAHIDTWYTIRPATESEAATWSVFVAASAAQKSQRTNLNARGFVFDAAAGTLEPTSAMTRVLDSYDDRWEPPTAIILTPEQITVEMEFLAAETRLHEKEN